MAVRAEWQLDVPTIGNVYRNAHGIVHYFNGLGCLFQVGALERPRHWVNRAWTVQELGDVSCSIIGGMHHRCSLVHRSIRAKGRTVQGRWSSSRCHNEVCVSSHTLPVLAKRQIFKRYGQRAIGVSSPLSHSQPTSFRILTSG